MAVAVAAAAVVLGSCRQVSGWLFGGQEILDFEPAGNADVSGHEEVSGPRWLEPAYFLCTQ